MLSSAHEKTSYFCFLIMTSHLQLPHESLELNDLHAEHNLHELVRLRLPPIGDPRQSPLGKLLQRSRCRVLDLKRPVTITFI